MTMTQHFDHKSPAERRAEREQGDFDATLLWLILGAMFAAFVCVFLFSGCSRASFRESYDGAGNLASREVVSTNALNWIESSFNAEQIDGAYNLGMGTRGGLDPKVAEIAQTAAVAAQVITGMSALRRATPDSAFGPVSVDNLGGMAGMTARPITAEQVQALADQNNRRIEVERIRADNERLKAELEEAQAALEEAHAGHEAKPAPATTNVGTLIQSDLLLRPPVASQEVK